MKHPFSRETIGGHMATLTPKTRRIMAGLYASRLVNGDATSTRNPDVVKSLVDQFENWPDIDQRASLRLFLVQLMPITLGMPNLMAVQNFAVSAKLHMDAAKQVADLKNLNMRITMGTNTFQNSHFSIRVNDWRRENYMAKFTIV